MLIKIGEKITGKTWIWNNEKKKVERVKLDLDFVCEDLPWGEIEFSLRGKCPFDGKKVIFYLVWKGRLSKRLEKEVEKIIQDTKHYTHREIKEFKEKFYTIIDGYGGFPDDTDKTAYCVHFAPTRYYSEEELENMRVDFRDIDAVEGEVAIVNINNVIQELVNEMKSLKRLKGQSAD